MAEPPGTWARLHTGYYDDPRLVDAGEPAELLFVRSIAWSKRNGTDGWLPDGVVERLVARGGRARATALVRVGAYELDARGGYLIRAYAAWQETTAEVEAMREDLRRRGRAGAHARWHGNSDGGGHGRGDG